jgi:hypothetical protein
VDANLQLFLDPPATAPLCAALGVYNVMLEPDQLSIKGGSVVAGNESQTEHTVTAHRNLQARGSVIDSQGVLFTTTVSIFP